jgi:hypothetical protein
MSRLNARSIAKSSAWVTFLVLVACIALSAVSLLWLSIPAIDSLLGRLVEKYDERLPEITLKDGHASIRGKQPFVVDLGGEKDVALVIDTREGKEKEALEHLKVVEVGTVLTRNSIVVKSQGEVRTISLSGLPDMVVNGGTIQEAIAHYRPTVLMAGAALVFLYYCFAKSLQVLLFGLIPYFAARVYSIPLTYGESLKIATMAMVPVVLLFVVLNMGGLDLPAASVVYFALYVGLLVLAARDLKQRAASLTNSFGINPS